MVFGKQLSAWMVYGILDDPFNEFIITQNQFDAQESAQLSEGGKTQWFVTIIGIILARIDNLCSYNFIRRERGYNLEISSIPSFISSRTADSILFVGRAMATIRNSKRYVGEFQNVTRKRRVESPLTGRYL
jgi:hypothetical protein